MDQFRLHFGLPLPHTNVRDKSWDWCEVDAYGQAFVLQHLWFSSTGNKKRGTYTQTTSVRTLTTRSEL
jgi:hypothetical protein